ncbi:hypothetical protein [Ralstonia pseudosolanacearum]|uniref:hypothetical protein n=1 Tax=Ralstonia pseudosolanacearum TaxID=1310165 RepID=UPI00048BF2B9|nr:hypothetical protein [Ralstonia pseudosolanacearum]MDO3559581.1 hypothetical protein [Ralstonia pseudosolanacearum]MDO3579484.1 hypothetical protein [Ralstonia pseudosolanacearum]MDO3589408.1 hypothetical protein [Ralstonia pseudosolanacearum]
MTKLHSRYLNVGEWIERTLPLSIAEIGTLDFLENLYWRLGKLPPKAALLHKSNLKTQVHL